MAGKISADEFRAMLKNEAASAVSEFNSRSESDTRVLFDWEDSKSAELATHQDAMHAFDTIVDRYDSLYDVHSDQYHHKWRSNLVYDSYVEHNNLWQIAGRISTGFRKSAFVPPVHSEGSFHPVTEKIVISSEKIPYPVLVSIMSSELCHAYQYEFKNSTTRHSYVLEGFELASKLKILDSLSEQSSDLSRFSARLRARYLVHGYCDLGLILNQIPTEADLGDLGLSDEAITAFKRPLKHVPRFSPWENLTEYSLFASLVIISHKHGVEDTFAKVFDPDRQHPWQQVIRVFDRYMDGKYRLSNSMIHAFYRNGENR